ncbi:MAG: hypothetical protein IPG55_03450 [Saprospiraceae bacterium]|nr:hypothetical protein [Candidatus Defluviibacterium haderslevense]MBK7244689.1 hypothetical protein [Candidatus Defluviibacterium haderslevense]
MDIINKKEITKFIRATIIISIIFVFVPLIIYLINFGGSNFSNNPANWGAFGDYFGGIIGTLFSLIAAFFSLISVYITLKIASRIQEAENKFNEENIIRETHRFEKEIELTERQNKPFPYLDLNKFEKSTVITLSNYGTGPLIVKQMYLLHNNSKIYPNIFDFLKKNVKTKITNTEIQYTSAPTHILPPNTTKELASILPVGELTEEFYNYQAECRDLLKDCRLFIKYEDIFEKEGETDFSLIFLKN